jgi:hypothetical protein
MTFDAAVYERALRKPPDSMQTRRYSHRRLSIKKSTGNRKERTCRKADHARVPADRAASCVSSKKKMSPRPEFQPTPLFLYEQAGDKLEVV